MILKWNDYLKSQVPTDSNGLSELVSKFEVYALFKMSSVSRSITLKGNKKTVLLWNTNSDNC